MLGFAMRAGKLIIGTELVCRAMSCGKVKFVLVSDSASLGTKKKVLRKCEFYKIPSGITEIDTECLGKILGKTYPAAAVAVTDDGFAKEIEKLTVCKTEIPNKEER